MSNHVCPDGDELLHAQNEIAEGIAKTKIPQPDLSDEQVWRVIDEWKKTNRKIDIHTFIGWSREKYVEWLETQDV